MISSLSAGSFGTPAAQGYWLVGNGMVFMFGYQDQNVNQRVYWPTTISGIYGVSATYAATNNTNLYVYDYVFGAGGYMDVGTYGSRTLFTWIAIGFI